MPNSSNPGAAIGAANRQRVLDWLMRHPGATNNECAKATGLSIMAVSRHVKAIRELWPVEPASAPGGSGQLPQEPAMAEERELTFGEKAVGLSFNPSGDPLVQSLKEGFAHLIDEMNSLRKDHPSERGRLASIAITELQGAQMWAVKAATWRD